MLSKELKSVKVIEESPLGDKNLLKIVDYSQLDLIDGKDKKHLAITFNSEVAYILEVDKYFSKQYSQPLDYMKELSNYLYIVWSKKAPNIILTGFVPTHAVMEPVENYVFTNGALFANRQYKARPHNEKQLIAARFVKKLREAENITVYNTITG